MGQRIVFAGIVVARFRQTQAKPKHRQYSRKIKAGNTAVTWEIKSIVYVDEILGLYKLNISVSICLTLPR